MCVVCCMGCVDGVRPAEEGNKPDRGGGGVGTVTKRRVVLSQTSHTFIYKCKTHGISYAVFAGLRVFAHTTHSYSLESIV